MSRDEELRNVMHAWFLRLDEGTVTEEEWKAIERAIYYFDMQPGLMHAMHNLQIRLNNCMGYADVPPQYRDAAYWAEKGLIVSVRDEE